MALIKCKECGHEISSDAIHCPHCGAPLHSAKPTNSSSKANVKLFVILGILTGGTAGVLFAATSSHGGSIQQQNFTALLAVLCIISFVVAIIFHNKSKSE